MPCPPELLKRVETMVDNFLSSKKDEVKQQFFSKNTDIENPLDQPKQFLADGMRREKSAPQQIHGAGRRDLFR
jgi:hypothetical protein